MSDIKIEKSNDYKLFKFITGNRLLIEQKINKIVRSVENGVNYLPYNPIMIDNKFRIIDGQHRFVACERLNHPVYYVKLNKEIPVKHIAIINSNMSNWKVSDYVNCFADLGDNNYKTLNKLFCETGLNYSTLGYLLQSGKESTGGGSVNQEIKEGIFKVNFLDYTEKIIKMINDFLSIADFKGTHRPFVNAVIKFEKSDIYHHDQVINKLRSTGLKIQPKETTKEFIYHIEELFNYRNINRKRLVD